MRRQARDTTTHASPAGHVDWAAAASGSRPSYIAKLAALIHAILECAGQGPDGLARLSKPQLKEFTALVDSLDGHQGVDIAAAMEMKLWNRVLKLHGVAVRQLVQLTASSSVSKVIRVEILLGCILFLFIKTNALKTGSSLGSQLAVRLIRQDMFYNYACLLKAWTGLPGSDIVPKLRLMAQFSLIFSSIAQLTVSNQPLTPTDHTGTALYEECLGGLSRSSFLEHASKALLTALEAAADPRLPMDQARNIRLGVMETCGCIVSALHGIAGKQGMLDSAWARLEALGNEPPEANVARQLLLRVRGVLSLPWLQFLLGREIVASRLRITGGAGPRFGLLEVMLPELINSSASSPSQALTDRLLSRLGAAALVWHLVIPEGPQPQAEGLPFRPTHVFDMVVAALLCTVDPSIHVEHLPGGSQLTLVEPAMLLVRLTMRMKAKNLVARLGQLWQVLAALLVRPGVRLQYSDHRPLQLVGGLLRLDLQHGRLREAAIAAAAAAAALDGDPAAGQADGAAGAAAEHGCPFNLRCALGAGLLPALERLLRSWGRDDPATKSETSCLCAVNHLLRWPGVWPAVLAHGPVRDAASIIVSLRHMVEVFKERGFETMSRAGNNEPNEHQDAEVLVTAYMVALLEQLAVVLLLPYSGVDGPLALNDALEAGGVPVSVDALAQLGGRPDAGTPAAGQQQALAIFAVSQWLPIAVWLARVMDTWFSVAMGKAALRWVLEAALQCLAARDLSELELAEAQGAEVQGAEVQAQAQEAALSGDGEADSGGEASSSGSAGASSSTQPAARRPCGPGAVAYVAWVTFLMVAVDMLAWIHKYFGQLQELDESDAAQQEAAGGQEVAGEGGAQADGGDAVAGLNPGALLLAVLDVLEVLTLAVPRSVQMFITVTVKDSPPAPAAAAAVADTAAGAAGAASAAAQVASLAAETVQAAPTAAASTKAAGDTATAAARAVLVDAAATRADAEAAKAADTATAAAPAAEAEASTAVPLSAGAGVGAGGAAARPAEAADTAAPGSADVINSASSSADGATAAVAGAKAEAVVRSQKRQSEPPTPPRPDQPQPDSADSSSERPKLDRDIRLDGWLRSLLVSQNRQELLSVFEAWADRKSRSGGSGGEQEGCGSAAAASAPGTSPEQETPQLAALRAVVAAKHGLEHRPKLPSPYAAAAKVEAAGIKLCGNPSCCNLEGPSAAALSELKICALCRTVSYCSDKCQSLHWDRQHGAECPGAAQQPRSMFCDNPACTEPGAAKVTAMCGRKTCRCKSVSYCSGTCQLDHWRSTHSAECAEWAARKQAK
ncbi:hypothetical protein PLESTB_000716500 [Pleodorina starrii]|uniref:phytol kinase n=1 Tax=Pleodorina starrii TaxID=330485 RepID=A0A9W6BJ77_9CHLO|nr:hypothetical protein PLESTM_001711000 [Pleodorina starrii]GLC53177.1 hypothetical protein PLESTB_000716500 [Pleodorina starrii]GLC68632.1 hypothetical protein PLESTF_000717100 [Pleodorina starrii]